MLKKHKDISRVDQGNNCTHGWNVRIRFKGKIKSKFFADKKNGGSEKALKAAITWRNATEKEIGKVRTDKHLWTVAHSKSKTGIVGVCYSEKQQRYNVSWVATDGKGKKSSFSIKKYGKEAAFLKAVTLRNEKEHERLKN